MRAGRWAALAAVLVSLVVASAPAGAAPDPPNACKIERPDGLWPPYFYEDYWNTYTHGGFNSDWVAHPRPVGTVKAVVLFVDFPDRPASAVTQVSPIDYRQPQPYWEFLKASVPWFSTASYGRFNLEVTPIYKWYRMPRNSTQWRMDYRSNDPARRLSAEGQGEFTAAAVAAADADVDFSELRPDLHGPRAQPDRDRELAGAQQLHPSDRRRRQRPRQRRQLRLGHVQLGLQAPQPRDRPRGQPHRGLQRGHGRHVPLHGPVGHDGQHLRQRAGLHRLEQVEAGLAQRRRGGLRRLRRGHRAHAVRQRARPTARRRSSSRSGPASTRRWWRSCARRSAWTRSPAATPPATASPAASCSTPSTRPCATASASTRCSTRCPARRAGAAATRPRSRPWAAARCAGRRTSRCPSSG